MRGSLHNFIQYLQNNQTPVKCIALPSVENETVAVGIWKNKFKILRWSISGRGFIFLSQLYYHVTLPVPLKVQCHKPKMCLQIN